MNSTQNKKTKTLIKHFRKYIIALIILILLFMIIGILSLFNENKKKHTGNIRPTNNLTQDKNAVDISPPPQPKKISDIEIPVYSQINLDSGKKEQKVTFINPRQNNCYFVVSIFLPDNKLIYKSNLIAPGKALYNITLLEKIEKGEYINALLKYECYDMSDSLKQLNGADFKIDILVS